MSLGDSSASKSARFVGLPDNLSSIPEATGLSSDPPYTHTHVL